MAARIPDATVVTVPRGGHVLTHLDAPATRALAQFLPTTEKEVART